MATVTQIDLHLKKEERKVTNRIQPLTKSGIDAYGRIMADAYPGLKIVSETDRQGMRDRLTATFEDPSVTVYGLIENGRVLAGMILYDFTMNVRGTLVPAGGLGSLAVDLLYRKQKLAKEMVTFYLKYYRDRGVSLALLYPFRPDFYRRMGFGYGTKMNQYVFRPNGLRLPISKWSHIEYLGIDDVDRVLACHDRYAEATHGMILGSRGRVRQMLANPAIRTVGYLRQDKVLGYLAFDFESSGHFLKNDLRIRQLVRQDSAALTELLAFVRSLADQFDWIVINTQDTAFHHLLDDPRSRASELIPSVYHQSNTQGVGLMYRAIDAKSLLGEATEIDFGPVSITLKVALADTFMPENSRSMVVRFDHGRASQLDDGEYDAEIRMDVSDFSAMLMGAATFQQLWDYGLAYVSEGTKLKDINDLFSTPNEPICMTAF